MMGFYEAISYVIGFLLISWLQTTVDISHIAEMSVWLLSKYYDDSM